MSTNEGKAELKIPVPTYASVMARVELLIEATGKERSGMSDMILADLIRDTVALRLVERAFLNVVETIGIPRADFLRAVFDITKMKVAEMPAGKGSSPQ